MHCTNPRIALHYVRRPNQGRDQWWAKSNRDSIQSRFESQRRFDSKIARFDSSTMWFHTDSIQILTIWFKRHTIWTEISKSWLKLNTHSQYSLLSQILSSNVWFYPSLMYARNNSSLLLSGEALNGEINAHKSAAPKMEIPMVTIGRSGLCLNMANSAVMFYIKTN